MNILPWWPIALEEMKKGVAEVPGPGDNPIIQEYLRSTTIEADLAKEDETPWCSAFVNWCVRQAGHEGTDSALARSWEHWGRLAKVKDWCLGAIVVLERPAGGPTAGHVGFLAGVKIWENSPPLLAVLGGNQGNRVQISQYPAARLLGVRVP